MSWKPTEANEVQCAYCGYKWLYNGMTPYAQCPQCSKSNNLLDGGD